MVLQVVANPGAIGDNVDPEAPQRVGRPYA
jgi:hypothetical protein